MQFYCWEFNLRKLSNDSLNVSTGQNIQVSWILNLTALALALGSQWFLLAQKCAPETGGAEGQALNPCVVLHLLYLCVICSSQEDWNTPGILWELLSIGYTSKALWSQCPELPKMKMLWGWWEVYVDITCTITGIFWIKIMFNGRREAEFRII